MLQSPAEPLRPATSTTVGEPVPRHSRYILRPAPMSTSPAKSPLTAACPTAANSAAQAMMVGGTSLLWFPGIASTDMAYRGFWLIGRAASAVAPGRFSRAPSLRRLRAVHGSAAQVHRRDARGVG